MENPANLLTRIADKSGALGAIISAMGCSMCFPAIASLGAAIGLSFLAPWEGILVHILLPVFAGIALIANALGWFRHRQWHRSVLGMIGPAIVILASLVFLGRSWDSGFLYVGLALMVAVSIWDLVSPANRHCGPETCEPSTNRA